MTKHDCIVSWGGKMIAAMDRDELIAVINALARANRAMDAEKWRMIELMEVRQ